MADKIYTIKGSTLTGMANALRSGLGDIGPIKGDELEARTLEVVGMIGSGGGGGSLPAGVYWKVHKYPAINKYYQSWFRFKGVLYATVRTDETIYAHGPLYQYNDDTGKWTKVAETFEFGRSIITNNQYRELNGKLICGGQNYQYFRSWDGNVANAPVTMANAPNKISSSAWFVHNGVLKAYSEQTGVLYVYDEAADAWSEEATIGSKYAGMTFAVVNGEVYCFYSYKLYKYRNGALEDTGLALPTSNLRVDYVDGNFVYSYDYRYNVVTGEYVAFAPYPSIYDRTATYNDDGEFHILYQLPNYNIVNVTPVIVEETE